MKKFKLSVLIVFIIAISSSFLACNNEKNIEIPLSTSDIVNSKQTNKANLTTNVLNTSNVSPMIVELEREYSENLCTKDEDVLLSFKLDNSSKILSICVSKTQEDYIVYRFGNKDKIELEFPKNNADSWSKFTYSYYMRAGGVDNDGLDLNYLSFENEGYKYKIYQEYIANDNITNIGIKTTDMLTNKETDNKGLSESIEGSLISLRRHTKIDQVELGY